MDPHRDLYTVKKGDTLWKIAKAHNTTVDDLKKLNGIKNPRELHEGQRIALRREVVGGFRVLLLDRDRNPIRELPYRLVACNKTYTGKTAKNGETQRIVTDSPFDMVHIWLQRNDGTWKMAASVLSGFGDKQTVLVSAHIVVNTKTEKHPDLPPNAKPDPKERGKPAHAEPPKQTPNKDSGILPKQSKTADGKPLTVAEGDIACLDEFLDSFNGELMTDSDYEWAAKELGVEIAAVKAYAAVESGAGGFISIAGRKLPAILYERHKFSKHTKHRYSAKYPDISLPAGYYSPNVRYIEADDDYKKRHGVPPDVSYYRPITKADEGKSVTPVTLKEMLKAGTATESRDRYLRGFENYKRLIKAYQLDQDAALMSCSWGAFQILGEFWKTMGYSSAKEYTKAMSRSEKEQIQAFVRYIKRVNPAIIKHLNKHDWARAAEAYNGPSYKQNHYDVKLEAEYKRLAGKK